MPETRKEYLKRIHFVLDFIETHLDTDLSLEKLSEKAHYSPYHFHRVFLTVVDERLNAYINRKRIERIASILLVDQNTPINDLAYQYGFNSGSSFSRAFKKYYGISPTDFKSKGKKLLSKIGIDPFTSEKYICSITQLKEWNAMNAQITVEKLSDLKLATLSHIGDFDKLSSMFQKLMEWGHHKGILDRANFKAVTIYHDNPNVTQTSKLRFSAGVTIKKNSKTDGNIKQTNLRSGTYAVGHFEIKGEEIPKAWKSVCVWVLESGHEFRDGDYFEVYLNDHKTHPEQKFILDICVPIEKTTNRKPILDNRQQVLKNKNILDYHQLIDYMKELRAYFNHEYDSLFKLGAIYRGSPDYSYFSLTTEELKKQKLKFVIILDHKEITFSICLSGQNKTIRKKYWQLFKGSDWDKYHIAETMDNNLLIVDHTLVESPDFNFKEHLTIQIEKESLNFINEIRALLES